MKRITAGFLLGVLVSTAMIGCGKGEKETSGNDVLTEEGTSTVEVEEEAKKVSVFRSGSESEAAKKIENRFTSELIEKGEGAYEVLFFYADDDASCQSEQIEKALSEENMVLVVEPVDAYGLTECLEIAKEKDVPVISYENLIMDTDAVSYYVTYSYREMGNMIGEAIKEEKKLEKAREEQNSYQIEFLMGSQDSIDALFFYNGVMEVLQEYLDDGTLICPSSKTTFDDTGILRWDEKQAKKRFEKILTDFYMDGSVPDIVCTGFDGAAAGVAECLEKVGILPEDEDYPLLTGMGSETDELQLIAEGKQYCTIFLNPNALAEICAQMTAICANGDTPEVNDKAQFDNGVKIISTNVCEAKLITEANNGEEAEKESEMEIEEETDEDTETDAQDGEDWEEVDVENEEDIEEN